MHPHYKALCQPAKGLNRLKGQLSKKLVIKMNHDYWFGFFYLTMGFACIILMDNLKKFILSAPAGRKLVTADISIIQATTAQVSKGYNYNF